MSYNNYIDSPLNHFLMVRKSNIGKFIKKKEIYKNEFQKSGKNMSASINLVTVLIIFCNFALLIMNLLYESRKIDYGNGTVGPYHVVRRRQEQSRRE